MGRDDLAWRFTWVAAGFALLGIINRDFPLGLWAAIGAVLFAVIALVLFRTRRRQPPD